MIYLFNGPPGSGKDEACAFLKNCYGMIHLEIKDELFDETCKYFGVSKQWFMSTYHTGSKDIKVSELKGLSRREALIHVSEDIIKPKYGMSYYGLKTSKKINLVSNYCISDCGFIDEVKPIINIFGKQKVLIQLYKENCNFSKDSRSYIDGTLHEEFICGFKSKLETSSENLDIKMYRIHNNSTIKDFHTAIRKII